jgi:hypothetical protein
MRHTSYRYSDIRVLVPTAYEQAQAALEFLIHALPLVQIQVEVLGRVDRWPVSLSPTAKKSSLDDFEMTPTKNKVERSKKF